MTRYDLSVGEPWDFDGPDGQNRVLVEYAGIVTSTSGKPGWSGAHLLFRVLHPFVFNGGDVNQLVARPRYEGDTTDSVRVRGGTVGACRVTPGHQLSPGDVFSPDAVEYIIIGSLAPIG